MEEREFKELYSDSDWKTMQLAEDSINRTNDRVDELVVFARAAGMKRIGIANCISFEKESVALEKHLEQEGFEVVRVHCKVGKIPRSAIRPESQGTLCNPAGQAAVLNGSNTEMNLVLGLCVGHDIVFNKKSEAPTSTLVVKDRKRRHHTMERLDLMVNGQ